MRPLLSLAFAVVLTLTALSATVLAGPPSPTAYLVVVNPTNPAATLDQGFLADAFLKKITHWPNDTVIRPVDLGSSSPVRRRFSEEVLQRSVEAVKNYWQQRIFSGRDVPPPELDTDEEVVRYVVKYAGAVGYVSATANVSGVKVVTVR